MRPHLPPFHESEVVNTAKKAGTIIMQELANAGTLGIQGKSDDSPVTQADLRANACVVEALSKMTPGVAILSEEMKPEEQAEIMKKDMYWCVDPLDGTKTAIKYSEGQHEQTGFGVLIALVKNGVPVFGVAHYPAEKKTYYTSANGQVAYRQEGDSQPERLRANRTVRDTLTVAAGYRGAAPDRLSDKPVENHASVGGSRIIRAAEGAVDIGYMGNDGPISFGFWDLAAPHAILKAAGGELVTIPGDFAQHQQPGALRNSLPLRYDGSMFIEGKKDQPYLPACVAAHRDTLQALGAPDTGRARSA